MPKVSRETASDTLTMDGYEGRYENPDGGYTVGFESYTEDADLAGSSTGCRTTAASARTGVT